MDFLFIYLLKGSIGIAFCVVFYKLVLEGLTFFSMARVTMLILLISSISLPLLSFDFQFLGESTLTPINSTLTWLGDQSGEVASVGNSSSFDWKVIPFLIFLLGALYRMLHLISGVLKTVFIIRNSKKIKSGNLTLVINSKFIPASFFNYILLPDYSEDDEDLKQILLHESVHVDQGHTWDILFLQLIKAVFWFNPAVYLVEKQIREIHEFQADQGVTSSYSKIAYSRLLVKQLSKDCGLQFMNNFNQFQTKKRIIMMNKTKSKSNQKLRLALSLPMMVLMVGLFSCNLAMSQTDLTGLWTGTEFHFEQTQGPDMSAMIEGGKALHEGGKLNLKKDGSLVITSGSGDVNGRGVWKKVDDKTLLIHQDSGEVTYFEIVSASEKELITKQEVEFETPMGLLAGIITLTYTR